MLDWLSRNKRVTWTFVRRTPRSLDYDGQRVLLGISTVGLADTFRRGAHADYVRQALIDVLGVDARVDGSPLRRRRAVRPSGAGTVGPSGARRRLRRMPSRAPAPARVGRTAHSTPGDGADRRRHPPGASARPAPATGAGARSTRTP